LLYKVRVGRDEYLGTPEEVVAWMARAPGAPGDGTPAGFMATIAGRLAAHEPSVAVDTTAALPFLASLAAAGWIRLAERREASRDRADPEEALGEGPVAFGDDVDWEDLRRDVFGE
jgi:hypothetical protein